MQSSDSARRRARPAIGDEEGATDWRDLNVGVVVGQASRADERVVAKRSDALTVPGHSNVTNVLAGTTPIPRWERSSAVATASASMLQ
jgi:hypothetical protein